jgi:aryl sulfotransferase
MREGVPPGAVGDGRAPTVVWLASYPKSGNTWIRALLASYLSDRPPDLGNLPGGSMTTSRQRLDDALGFDSCDLTAAELAHYRRLYHLSLGGEAPSFIKVHDAFERNAAGQALFPADSTRGLVYIVRDPRDVALSYAHHNAASVDATIDAMADPRHALPGSTGELLPVHVGAWSFHVEGWLDSGLPMVLVRYEDLAREPVATLGAILRHVGLPLRQGGLEEAVACSTFEALRDQEVRQGFPERQPTARSFFRAGRAGSWRTELAPGQAARIEGAHGAMMERLGYLVGRDYRP